MTLLIFGPATERIKTSLSCLLINFSKKESNFSGSNDDFSISDILSLEAFATA